ncbi:MAG: polymerase LigD, ligase domain protein [Acidimicrobiales bacterium]|nr:polymerase LigD, ligase domain protein [Acidimicrobiales bacterium]
MAPPPAPILPMKAASGSVPTDAGWAFEIKWDGMRVVARVADEVRLTSARGADVTVRYPELAGLVEHLGGHRAVLDGEVVAFDPSGRTDFGRLQPRMHTSDPAQVARLRSQIPISYVVFDLLELDGVPTVDLPYTDRRRLLVDLVEPDGAWMVPAHQVGDGLDLYEAATARGLEGIMAKRLDSTYRPGRRSSAWRKCKIRREQEVVVGGWSTGEGARSTTLGSLLVGVHDPTQAGNPLRYAGGIGTGFDDATLRDLQARLAALVTDDCPFSPRPPAAVTRTAHWVRPELVVQAAFGEWTGDGRLRHPSYVGLRSDKDPAAVVREPEPG